MSDSTYVYFRKQALYAQRDIEALACACKERLRQDDGDGSRVCDDEGHESLHRRFRGYLTMAEHVWNLRAHK